LLDKEFTKNYYDQYGIFSHVFIGGEPENPQDYDHEKYGHIETVRISNTKDSRRNISHEYRVELYDKEKLCYRATALP
jgi:hypothetical protein